MILGVQGNIYVGGNGNVNGVMSILSTYVSTSTVSGALLVAGGAGITYTYTITISIYLIYVQCIYKVYIMLYI